MAAGTLLPRRSAAAAAERGAAGEGVGKFPSLTEDKGFAGFAKVVREGKDGKAGVMPSFSEAYVSDADLLRIYVTLTNKSQTEERTFGCREKVGLDEAAIAAAFQKGLAQWRAPDFEKAACAYGRGIDLEKMPKEPQALALYKTFAANTYRMMALLATEHIQRTGRVSDRGAMHPIYRSTAMEAFSTKHESPEVAALTKRIVDEYEAAVDAACDRRPLRYKEAAFPGHCDHQR